MRDRINNIWLIPPTVFLLIFFYVPLTHIFSLSGNLSSWKEIVTDSLFNRFLMFTFFQAILTVIFSAVIGTLSGYLLAHGEPYGRRFLSSSLTVPFLLPPLSILVGFVYFFEPAGLLSTFTLFSFDIFGNPWSIVLAHTLYNISVFTKITASGFKSEPSNLHMIAAVEGASWFRRLKTITFPHILPMILASSLITFLYAFNSFAIVLLLGEVRLQTLEVMIYVRTKLRFDFVSGAVVAVLQLSINVLVVLGYLRYSSKKRIWIEESDYLKYDIGSWKRVATTFALLLVVSLTWFPILSTFIKFGESYSRASLPQRQQLISGTYDSLLGTSPVRALINTVWFAFLTGVFAVLFTIMFLLYLQKQHGERRKHAISFFTILPMATSGVTMAFAILALYGRYSSFSSGVWIFILATHLLASLPFVVRSILTSFEFIHPDLLHLSEILGANSLITFRRVVFPQIKSGIIVGFLFATAISVGEFGSTFYLSRGEWVTMSTAIGKLFNSRYTMLPLFFASLLSLVSLILFTVIEWVGNLDLKV